MVFAYLLKVQRDGLLDEVLAKMTGLALVHGVGAVEADGGLLGLRVLGQAAYLW